MATTVSTGDFPPSDKQVYRISDPEGRHSGDYGSNKRLYENKKSSKLSIWGILGIILIILLIIAIVVILAVLITRYRDKGKDDKEEEVYMKVSALGSIAEVYVDGINLGILENASKPYIADTYRLTSMPDTIAVKVKNTDFISTFLLVEVTNGEDTIYSSDMAQWRCSQNMPMGTTWTSGNYDADNSWYTPVMYAKNGDITVSDGKTPMVGASAAWINHMDGLSQMWCNYVASRTQTKRYPDVNSAEKAIRAMIAELKSPGSSNSQMLISNLLSMNLLSSGPTIPVFIRDTMPQDLVKELEKTIMETTDNMRQHQLVILRPDDPFPVPSLGDGACWWPEYDCSSQINAKYRTVDGSCNNLQNPRWGRSFIPLRRSLQPQYADGSGSIKQSSYGTLPSPRKLSTTLAEDKSQLHRLQSMMMMVFGQILDHDVDLTVMSSTFKSISDYSRKSDITCGMDGCDKSQSVECAPIMVPDNDPGFKTKKCIKFIRSKPIPDFDCKGDVRQQLNKITSYIDVSFVYGSTRMELEGLRNKTAAGRGLLREQPHPMDRTMKGLLPTTTQEANCRGFTDVRQCFKAGDARANEHHALTILHTIFMREHNRLETLLHEINPHWDGDRLLNEARKILGAQFQYMVYNEYLPLTLGKDAMRKYGLEPLKSGYYSGYKADVDVSTSNVFATAAFRYGHSLVSNFMQRADENWNFNAYPQLALTEQFWRPHELYNIDHGGIDAFLRGIVAQRVEKCDRYMPNQLTVSMFTEKPPKGEGLDLFSINVHRGRDHGLPGYNDWREYCGLSRATSFADLVDILDQETRDKFAFEYSHIDDLDLFAAGISEKSLPGALVGPTFACLLGEQFKRYREGDRFWFENPTPQGFTAEQLNEIRKVTFGKVLCDNSDNIQDIQPYVLQLPFRNAYPTNSFDEYDKDEHGLSSAEFADKWQSNFNAIVPCSSLPSLDLTKWKE